VALLPAPTWSLWSVQRILHILLHASGTTTVGHHGSCPLALNPCCSQTAYRD
jgi:hypothetical protein